MLRHLYLYLLFIFFMQSGLYAQDHIYSQFYNSPNYLNPALNGQFDGDLRVNLIYRNQWTSIPGPLTYYTFSVDLNVPQLNGGLGLMITKSTEGTAYLNKINIAGIYSYSVEMDNSVLSFGLQAGFTNRKIDYDKLVFLDQLGTQGIINGGSTFGSVPVLNNKYFFDSGAGVNFVLGDFMAGASGQHMNKPNESLTGGLSQLPVRYNGYASYKIPVNTYLGDGQSIIPSVVYSRQAGLNSFSAGMQYKNNSVNVGAWYRGEGKQNDAFVISLIFDLFGKRSDDKTRFGISHDVTTSKLPYTKTSGTTEAAFSYETRFPGSGNYRRSERSYGNKCYDFY